MHRGLITQQRLRVLCVSSPPVQLSVTGMPAGPRPSGPHLGRHSPLLKQLPQLILSAQLGPGTDPGVGTLAQPHGSSGAPKGRQAGLHASSRACLLTLP